MFKHHGTGPDLADGIGDALAGDIRRTAMHRFEQAGELAFRIDIGRGRHSDSSGTGRAQVGENVAKQVAGNHDIEPVGMQDEVGGKDVDMELVDMDLGVVVRHGGYPLVPPGHGNSDAIGLGRRGKLLAWPGLGQLESVLQHPVGAVAGHDRFLNDNFALGAFKHFATDTGVFALGILAYDVEINIAGLTVGQWAFDAWQQLAGAQVDVLIEPATELQQRAPQRNMVRYGVGPAHRAIEDGVEILELLEPVVGQHLAVLHVIVAAGEIEMLQGEVDIEALGSGLEHAQAFRHYLVADTVAGNDCDTLGHEQLLKMLGAS